MNQVLLVGAGPMGVAYAKVLKHLNVSFTCICRTEASAKRFYSQTGSPCQTGGLSAYLSKHQGRPSKAIICVPVDQLASVTMELIRNGVKHILVEKPGGMTEVEIAQVAAETKSRQANVYVAYNRRFYPSVRKAMALIEEDEGVLSCHFDFTERSKRVDDLVKNVELKNNWFLANSTHVIDLAFFLCGPPVQMNTNIGGGLPWHPQASVFSGSGKTVNNALFSYHSNWSGPGGWRVEIVTKKRKLLLEPLEELRVLDHDETEYKKHTFENNERESFKPGLQSMVTAFLKNDHTSFITIGTHSELVHTWYQRIKKGV
ncbi:Gfo/Idh/MocA family protein [Alteribacter aurantiacus]|uniref:Gfo/Idh/MocA family protein n=1 Tax=Alteribacter aurantiacus TaxID=254410 RepID=UPI00040ADEAD|nr:Gfo/Idh/MocA family oxidoreductase [Alteribacter aurantiacus]